jgi:DNA-binding transcriptional LysR family regulator
VLPPEENPLRIELESVAKAEGVVLHVPLEVEGIRLIPDLVAAGTFASIIPETAVPPELANLRSCAIVDMPPRRLAIVSTRDVQLSLADRAVRESVERLVARRSSPLTPRRTPARRARARRA